MLDLFCGRWGWSKAFAARGWECTGVDLVKPPEVPVGYLFQCRNVLDMDEYQLAGFDFICASPPCEQFSVHGMKHFHHNAPYPELGIKLFNHTRTICEASGIPYVMENVRAAQQFVGNAVHHCGPFYLWGTGVPPLMHQGINKNERCRMMPGELMEREMKNGKTRRQARNDYQREVRRLAGDAGCAAYAATIPPELANCVADYAERLLESKMPNSPPLTLQIAPAGSQGPRNRF